MRHSTSFLLFSIPAIASAQVANGSFEEIYNDQFTGWSYTCECGAPTISMDTPGGTGSYSLDLTAENVQCLCNVTFDLYQDLPWLTPGTWTLSYWIKGHDGLGPPPYVAVAYRTGLGFPALSNQQPGVTDTNWTYHEDMFNWNGTYPPVDSLLLVVAGGAAMDGERHPRFDDIQLTSISTSAEDAGKPARALWYHDADQQTIIVRSNDRALRLVCQDASGRLVFDLSLEASSSARIPTSTLAPGVYLMHDGEQCLRFVKN